jgi:CheY-like chemotaxis protein
LVLVVESEAPVRTIVKATLGEYGYRVLTAADGEQALTVLAEQLGAVKLVLTGLSLSDMHAAALIAAIRRIAPSPKFIVVSGTMEPERLGQITATGDVGFLAKPFTAEQLLRAMAKALSSG